MDVGEPSDSLRSQKLCHVMAPKNYVACIQTFTLHSTPLGRNLQVPKPAERQLLSRPLLVQMRCIQGEIDAWMHCMAAGPDCCRRGKGLPEVRLQCHEDSCFLPATDALLHAHHAALHTSTATTEHLCCHVAVVTFQRCSSTLDGSRDELSWSMRSKLVTCDAQS